MAAIVYCGTGATLYFVDLTQETLSCRKIDDVPGVSAISGLYVDGEQRREADSSLVFREGTVEICSSVRSFAYAPAEAEMSADTSLVADQVKGSANAAATVEFDSEKLELVHVAVHADYKSVETGDGAVRFAYANQEEIAAGQPIATLTFRTKLCVSSDITITHHQVNEENPAYEETVLATSHEVQLQNAKEATCTEAGYTGDEVCTVCGRTLKQGEEIPAHCASGEFTDLDISSWYHQYTDYVLDRGLMQGMGNGIFAPTVR